MVSSNYLQDEAFGFAMIAGIVVIIAAWLWHPARAVFDRIRLLLLGVAAGTAWFGGQGFLLGRVTYTLLDGSLRLGLFWLAALGFVYYLFFRQVRWLVRKESATSPPFCTDSVIDITRNETGTLVL